MPSPQQQAQRITRVQPYRIDKFWAFPVDVEITLAAPALSQDITAALTAVLATAGENGTSLPLQVATSINANGVDTPATAGGRAGLSTINLSSDGSRPADAGAEVYIRTAEAAGVYTTSFFKSDGAGGEAAVTLPAGTYVIGVPYVASIELVPYDFAFRTSKYRISQDVAAAGQEMAEHLTLVADNVIPAMAATPRPGSRITMRVGGRDFASDEPAPIFNMVGQVPTLIPANIDFPIYIGEVVTMLFIV